MKKPFVYMAMWEEGADTRLVAAAPTLRGLIDVLRPHYSGTEAQLSIYSFMRPELMEDAIKVPPQIYITLHGFWHFPPMIPEHYLPAPLPGSSL